MTSYEECNKIEAAAWKDLLPMLQSKSFEGRFVFTDKGRLSKILQETVGDVVYNDRRGSLWAVELKSEESNRWGNLFLETWSNRSKFNPGWMFKSDADMLWYYFLKEKLLYIFHFPELKKWAFVEINNNSRAGRIWDFKAAQQKKRAQKNDTWGRCVPIKIITEEIRHGCYRTDNSNIMEF